MLKTFYYCVLKNYKGKFIKKHRGNTHLFLAPISNNEYLYLGLVGLMVGEEDTHATQLIVRLPSEIIVPFINHEIKYFKGRFEVVDKVKCVPSMKDKGSYYLQVSNPSYYIKSDLSINYQLEYSVPNRRIYTIEGNLSFMAGEVNPHNLSMMATKQKAGLNVKSKNRFLSKSDLAKKAARGIVTKGWSG